MSSAPARRRTRRQPPKKRPPKVPDPTTLYAREVLDGRVVACKLVQQACARHLEDLKDGAKRGLHFDRKAALGAIAFFRTLKYPDGPRVGEYIKLEPWLEFITGSLMGWKNGEVRRFRQAYIEVAKKQSKSTWLAGLMQLLTFHDDEVGTRGYCAATTRDQTKNVFEAARSTVLQSPPYRRRLKVFQYLISDPKMNQQLLAVGARENSLEGLRPKALAIDELHLHPTPAVLEVLRRGQRAQRQPMCVMITTAGWNRNSVCWRERELARKILDPDEKYEDDREFVFIATLDEEDDYHDERVWVKAMPNLDHSVARDDVRADIKRADEEPEELPALLQKVFNRWVSNSIDRAIDLALWDTPACMQRVDLEKLKGRQCFAALDLAPVHDLSSLALIFPPVDEGELWKYVGRHFIPDADIRERSRRDKVPYERWAKEGWVLTTPGDQTDPEFIIDEVLDLAKVVEIREFAEDPAFTASVSPKLQRAELLVVDVRMGYMGMTFPCNELLRLVRAKQLQHGGDPVLRWAAGNLVLRSGPMKRVMPDKERSRERIDPMVSLIMAVGRAAVAPPAEASSYEERGPRSL